MSEKSEWTLEVRPASDSDAVREITLEQLRHELRAGTISAGDEVRSTFALDGQWRTAADIAALAPEMAAPPAGFPPHLPFAIAAVVIACSYVAILGADILKTDTSLAMWLLLPVVAIGAVVALLMQQHAAVTERWPAAALGSVVVALVTGAVVGAASVGLLLVGSVCLSLVISAFAAVFVERKGADATWRALCAFSIPIATIIGGIVRSTPTWFSDTALPHDGAGLWAFMAAAVALPALVIVRFRE